MHLAVLLWGFTGVLGRAISVDSPVLVWYRTLLTAVMMLVILFYRKQWSPIEKKDRWYIALIGGLIGIHWVAFYGAIQFANTTIALVCLSTASVFTSMLDPLVNGGRYKLLELLLGLMALVGVYLIYSFQDFYGKGIALGVIAAILSSVFTVLNKRIANKYPPRLLVFYEMSAGWIVVSIVIGALMAGNLQHLLISPKNISGHLQLIPVGYDWLWLPVMALCCTVWAQSLALSALQQLSSFTVTLSVNLEPVYGILLVLLIPAFRAAEARSMDWGFFLGAGLIMLSVAIQMVRLLRPKGAGGFVEERAGMEP